MKIMRYQKDGQHFLLVLEHGKDNIKKVTHFAQHWHIKFDSVSDIRACDNVVLNYRNLETSEYEKRNKWSIRMNKFIREYFSYW